jgi:WD40 repeat protein/serine/threonine protein kinase
MLGVEARGADAATVVSKTSATIDPAGASPLTEQAGQLVGRYRLLEQIGEGGFGTVWMAEQQEPVRRKVALKIIKLGMDTKQVVARFEAERQALAMMDHPNIARVFDGGATEHGRPFFVMELVRGIPLTTYCDTARLGTRERLELFIQVCQAVQHAHQKGIIHRDLKPTNILVTEQDGRAIPKVIDFGIAKATEQKLTELTLFTRFNQMLGTPAYMSPEQAGLGSLDIDTRTDIYSLGVLLYELLTGRTPLDPQKLRESGYDAILKTIREAEPPRPSTCLSALKLEDLTAIASRRRDDPQKLHRLIRGDLDWIALKALEKDRARRYDSANGLAADVRRYLDNEPIVARPPSNLYRFQKLARRNKLLFGATSAVVIALVFGLLMAFWQAFRATHNLSRARLNAYAAEINLAQQALAENNLSRAVELLDHHRPKSGENNLRGFEWRYLWQLSRPNQLATFHPGAEAVAFSPDGKLLATATTNIIVRETASRRVVAILPGEALSLAFSSRDKILASGEVRYVRLWSTETWREVRPPLVDVGFPARFSPDGAWLLTGAPVSPDQKHRLWRTDTWESVASCLATPELPWQLRNAIAFSPDGTLLVTPWLKTTNDVCGLKLWKVPSLELVANLFPDELPAWSAAFLPDGQHLLVGTFLGDLVVWDIPTRKIVDVIKEGNAGVTSIAVAPGAQIFAITSHDHRVSLWDCATRKIVARFRGHTHSIWASALSPDGTLVATGSFDGTAKLWDGTARESSGLIEHGSLIAGFTSDSRTLVLAPREGDYRWHLVSMDRLGHSTVEVPAQPPLVWDYIQRQYDIFGDVPIGVLGRTDGSIELWNLAAGQRTASWKGDTNAVTAASFSPGGTRLATGNVKGQIKLWNVITQDDMATFDFPTKPGRYSSVAKLVFSPDGKTLAAGTWPLGSGDVGLWDIDTKRRLPFLRGPGRNVSTIAFSPDGRLLAAGSMGPSEVYVWDLPSGKRHSPLKGHVTGIVQVLFSPDGKTLATGGYDTVKLWNIATDQEIASLPTRGTLRELCFSPDGRILAVGYLNFPGQRVKLFRAPSFEEIATVEKDRIQTLQP